LARHKRGKPLTTGEIAIASAANPTWRISHFEVEALSQTLHWNTVDYLDMMCFLRGCGTDFCNPKDMKRVDDYLATNPDFTYLHRSPEWKNYYLPMLKRWRGSQPKEPSPNLLPLVRRLMFRLTPLLDVGNFQMAAWLYLEPKDR